MEARPVRTTAPQRRRRTIDWRVVALLFGSVGFVLNATVAVHELGHLTLDRLFGLDASIVLEPFGGSFTVLAEPWPADMSVWPVVAGPMANVGVGLGLFLGLWSRRNPYLLSFLLWAPIALIQESTTALVQIGTGETGTDWVLISDAGLPGVAIVGFALVGLAVGLAGLCLVVSVAGLGPETTVTARLGTLTLGMGGFPAVALGLSSVLPSSDADVGRSLRVFAFALAIAMVLALSYPTVARLQRQEVAEVPRGAVWTGVALLAAILVVFGLF